MKSQKFFAALLAGALTLGVVPFTQFNADINAGPSVIISPDKNEKLEMEGENLNPSECFSEPIIKYNDEIYKDSELMEKDKEELMKGLESGYVQVPSDPNQPIKALTEEEVQNMTNQQNPATQSQDVQDSGVWMEDGEIPNEDSANPDVTQSGDSQASAKPDIAQQPQANPDVTQQNPRAGETNTNKSAIIKNVPYNGDDHFAFLQFKATKGDTSFKRHNTTYKTLDGNLDTSNVIFCLQINKANPPTGTTMNNIKKESDALLYLIRLGNPARCNSDRVPKEIRDCFYPTSKKDYKFLNYYLTQAAIWTQIGDTTKTNMQAAKPYSGAPDDLNDRVLKFLNLAPKYGPEWAAPKLWINIERKEAFVDQKDTTQYCTDAYELDVKPMDEPKKCLKLMERNVFTDLGERKPPAMTMTFPDGHPKGLRVLVLDKNTQVDRVYHVDNGEKPQLYGQDQFRFIIPNPKESGEFKYKIEGPCWTWQAYRYEAKGDYQPMLKEDVVTFGSNIHTQGEIFWNIEVPPEPDEYVIKAKKVDEKTGKVLPGAEFTLTKPNGRPEKQVTDNSGVATWDKLTVKGKYTVTETKAPEGYILPPNASQEVTLPSGSGTTVTVTFKDQPKVPDSFPIKVVKKDSADKKPLQGAEFTLTKPGGNKETGKSDVEGNVIFDNLTLTGKYIIEETKAPEGYELAKNPKQEVEVKDAKNPPTATFEFLNDKIPDKGRVELLKTDAVTNKPLEGVEFALYKKAGSAKPGEEAQKPEDSAKPDDNQKPDEDSAKPEPPKDTKANETQKPDDEQKPGEDSTKPGEEQKPEGEEQKPGEDSAKPDGEQKPGDNQKPDDSQQSSEDVLVGNFTTNAEGKIVVENLDPGDYYFVETKGLEGYIVDKEKLEFTIPGEGGTIQLTKHNKPEDSSVEITKTDVSTGEVLAGAKIKIYAEDKTTVLHEGVTDSSGKFAFGPLKPGKYYYQESGAPAGYILDDKLYEFEVKDNGEIVKCTLTNKPEEKPTPPVEKPVKGKLEITKVDISDGKLLPNAHFAIYDENKNQIMKGVTDSNGIATFELGAGKYFYQEYDAPIGYQLDDTLFPFEIKTDGEIVKCRMTNVPKPTPVPMLPTTGANIAVGGSLVAAVGAIASALFKRWM